MLITTKKFFCLLNTIVKVIIKLFFSHKIVTNFLHDFPLCQNFVTTKEAGGIPLISMSCDGLIT